MKFCTTCMLIIPLILSDRGDNEIVELFCKSTKRIFQLIHQQENLLRKNAKRKNIIFWPWQIEKQSFLKQCIENDCPSKQIEGKSVRKYCHIDLFGLEFCADEFINLNLNDYRSRKIKFCKSHVSKSMKLLRSSRQYSQSKSGKFSNENMFRGWWNQIEKYQINHCLIDDSNCADTCNIKNGICRLYPQKNGMKWFYKCNCDYGFGPSTTLKGNTEKSQFLCSNEIKEETESNKCNTLTIEESSIRVSASYLKTIVLANHTANYGDNGSLLTRQKRMVVPYANKNTI